MFEPGCEILQKYSLHRLCRKVFSHTLSISLPQSFKGESSLHLSRISRRLTSLKVLDSATFIALPPPFPRKPSTLPYLPSSGSFFLFLFIHAVFTCIHENTVLGDWMHYILTLIIIIITTLLSLSLSLSVLLSLGRRGLGEGYLCQDLHRATLKDCLRSK